jgi:hypothetical protein
VSLGVVGGQRVVDRGDDAVPEQEAMSNLVGVEVEADYVAAVVEADGRGDGCAGDVFDRRHDAAREHEAAKCPLAIEGGAKDLSSIVDVGDRGLDGTGCVDRSVDAPVEDEPVPQPLRIEVRPATWLRSFSAADRRELLRGCGAGRRSGGDAECRQQASGHGKDQPTTDTCFL